MYYLQFIFFLESSMFRFLNFFSLIVLIFFTYSAHAESSWDKLIGDIDHKQPGADKGVKLLEMPDMSTNGQSPNEQQSLDDVQVQVAPSYRCDNPNFPKCIIYLGDEDVDFENCRDQTKGYLQALASFNRCVDRQTRTHARKVVDYFNCKSRGERNCPFVY
jgi:hypothetical protein